MTLNKETRNTIDYAISSKINKMPKQNTLQKKKKRTELLWKFMKNQGALEKWKK